MSGASFQSASSSPTHCYCGIPVAKKQSWTSLNPGRRFVNCKFSNPYTDFKGCGFFYWVDGEMTEWQRVLINQLLLEKKLLEKEKEILKGELCNLADQKSNLVGDLEKMRSKLSEITQKKFKGKKRQAQGFKCDKWVVLMVVVVLVMAVLGVLMFV